MPWNLEPMSCGTGSNFFYLNLVFSKKKLSKSLMVEHNSGSFDLKLNFLTTWPLVDISVMNVLSSVSLSFFLFFDCTFWVEIQAMKPANASLMSMFHFGSWQSWADLEVKNSNTKESVLYFIRRIYNIFWTLSFCLTSKSESNNVLNCSCFSFNN